MNAKDYIESGILELYVAGALSESEKKEVEAMASNHVEIKKELESIEEAFEGYAFAHAIDPPKQVLNNILSVIRDKEVDETPAAKTIQMKPSTARNSNLMRYLAYAASILLFISLATNVYYYNSYTGVKEDLAKLTEENTFLTDQTNVIRADYQHLKSDLGIMKNPDMIAVTMRGTAVSPNSSSVVYWDKASGNLYVSVNNLPVPPTGKQYQLWALKDNKPIDAGVFDMSDQLQLMKNIGAADAFAVTLEPTGGSISPTMDQLYVVGGV
ncbi:MAG: anti-sigma factor domain-containing protein [Chitinophagales bacterium]